MAVIVHERSYDPTAPGECAHCRCGDHGNRECSNCGCRNGQAEVEL